MLLLHITLFQINKFNFLFQPSTFLSDLDRAAFLMLGPKGYWDLVDKVAGPRAAEYAQLLLTKAGALRREGKRVPESFLSFELSTLFTAVTDIENRLAVQIRDCASCPGNLTKRFNCYSFNNEILSQYLKISKSLLDLNLTCIFLVREINRLQPIWPSFACRLMQTFFNLKIFPSCLGCCTSAAQHRAKAKHCRALSVWIFRLRTVEVICAVSLN